MRPDPQEIVGNEAEQARVREIYPELSERMVKVMASSLGPIISQESPPWPHAPSYFGNSGSNLNPALCSTGGSYGPVSSDGIFFPNSTVKMMQVTDGTSNTILLGELSAALVDVNGKVYDDTFSVNAVWGWPLGGQGDGGKQPPLWNPFGGFPAYQCVTTTSYTINQRVPVSATTLTSGPGQAAAWGNNHPFRSNHSGGANFLFGDGTVKQLTNDLTLLTLKQLCSRNDGSTVTVP